MNKRFFVSKVGFILAVFSIFLLSSCGGNNGNSRNNSSNSSSGNNLQNSGQISQSGSCDIKDADSCNINNSNSGIIASGSISGNSCDIENCHGLDIKCGKNAPEMCDMMYALGDYCRQFAICEEVAGECKLKESDKFNGCKTCVEDCKKKYLGLKDPSGIFGCEDSCKKKYF